MDERAAGCTPPGLEVLCALADTKSRYTWRRISQLTFLLISSFVRPFLQIIIWLWVGMFSVYMCWGTICVHIAFILLERWYNTTPTILFISPSMAWTIHDRTACQWHSQVTRQNRTLLTSRWGRLGVQPPSTSALRRKSRREDEDKLHPHVASQSVSLLHSALICLRGTRNSLNWIQYPIKSFIISFCFTFASLRRTSFYSFHFHLRYLCAR